MVFENFWTCPANHFPQGQGDGVSNRRSNVGFSVTVGGRREGCPDGLECCLYGLQKAGGLCRHSVAHPSVKIG